MAGEPIKTAIVIIIPRTIPTTKKRLFIPQLIAGRIKMKCSVCIQDRYFDLIHILEITKKDKIKTS